MKLNEKMKAKAEFEGRRRLVKVLTWQGIIWNAVGTSVWMDFYYPTLSPWWKLGVGVVVQLVWITWVRGMTSKWEYKPCVEYIAKKIDEDNEKESDNATK